MVAAWPETLGILISEEGPLLPKKIVELSLQKYSSNVVDKLIQRANLGQIMSIMRELEKSDRLDKIMVSQYGNFVLQNVLNQALEFRDGSAFCLLQDLLNKLESYLL